MWVKRHKPGRPAALVLGDMELVRPLSLAGIRCGIVSSPNNAARFSRHTTRILDWDGDWDQNLGSHEEVLAARLVDYALTQPEPLVLFYQSDNELLFVSRHREQLRRGFRFLLPDLGRVEMMVDKVRFEAMARALSLPVPASRALDVGPDTSPDDLSDLGFPLILKPHQHDDGRWKAFEPYRKALRVDTQQALRDLWPRLSAVGAVVAQRCIGGPESRIESYHVYVDVHDQIVGEFTGHKLRTVPREYGRTTALRITHIDDVAKCGRELVGVLGLRGVAKFDFKRAPDGSLYLLEVNPRFNLWHHPGARAGVNLPALVFADLAGLPRPPVAPMVGEVRWCSPRDLKAAWDSGMSIIRWVPWALSCEAKAQWAWDDPLPFVLTAGSQLLAHRPHR
jgi:D-aspartate ligase